MTRLALTTFAYAAAATVLCYCAARGAMLKLRDLI